MSNSQYACCGQNQGCNRGKHAVARESFQEHLQVTVYLTLRFFFSWLFIYTPLRVTKVFVTTPQLYGPICIRALCGHYYLRTMATVAQVCSEAANVHFALSLEMSEMREQAWVIPLRKHAYFLLLSERKLLLRIKYMTWVLREAALPLWWTITDINTPAEANPDLCLPTSDALSFYPGSQILPPLSSPFKVNKTFKDL